MKVSSDWRRGVKLIPREFLRDCFLRKREVQRAGTERGSVGRFAGVARGGREKD